MKSPSAEQIRAWRFGRQRLDGDGARADAATLLADTGWMRSVGGVGPYLGLFARGRLSRATVDKEVAALAIHELPSARGCTYVVPARDFALALRAGQGGGAAAEIASAKKHLGVTDKEIDRLCARIVDALDEPADPKELKERLGEAVRHLGDAGKKRGMTTTLPLGLGLLQSRGEIRRVPTNGRLDQQRYRYVRWRPSPLAKDTLDDGAVARELARRFFRWAAPATVTQLAWWAGLGMKAAKAAVAELPLAAVGDGDERLIFADDLDALAATRLPKSPRVALLGSLDNLFHPRREVASMLDEGDADKRLPAAKQRLGQLADLDHHAIVAGGRLVGLWDYDAAAQAIVWAQFARPAVDVARAVGETEAFVRDQLGDARSFSLDSPESRGGRLQALRKLAAAR